MIKINMIYDRMKNKDNEKKYIIKELNKKII